MYFLVVANVVAQQVPIGGKARYFVPIDRLKVIYNLDVCKSVQPDVYSESD